MQMCQLVRSRELWEAKKTPGACVDSQFVCQSVMPYSATTQIIHICIKSCQRDMRDQRLSLFFFNVLSSLNNFTLSCIGYIKRICVDVSDLNLQMHLKEDFTQQSTFHFYLVQCYKSCMKNVLKWNYSCFIYVYLVFSWNKSL